jgi:hypothetical protein
MMNDELERWLPWFVYDFIIHHSSFIVLSVAACCLQATAKNDEGPKGRQLFPLGYWLPTLHEVFHPRFD